MLSIPRTPKCDDTNVTLNTPKELPTSDDRSTNRPVDD